MRSTKEGCFRSHSWSLWKALEEEGRISLVSWCLDLWYRSSWMLNIFSLKIKLNHSWKFRRNWNVRLVLLERSWWAGFNGIYLVRFGFRTWEILILKWFLPLKIQINSKNQILEEKINWKRGTTWANGTGHTSKWKIKPLTHILSTPPPYRKFTVQTTKTVKIATNV
jgi:hypothetical protein